MKHTLEILNPASTTKQNLLNDAPYSVGCSRPAGGDIMLTLLFVICLIGFIGKCFVFGLKASWGILKLLCYVMFFPVILIGMVVSGLIYIALPILIIGGIIAWIASAH